MNLQTSKNGGHHNKQEEALQELQNLNNGRTTETHHHFMTFEEDLDSTCSTPYVSAPSSPGHLSSSNNNNNNNNNNGYFFSAPASPMHFVLSSSTASSAAALCDASVSGSFEFEFSSRFCSSGLNCSGSMSSADELFLNGQIRPMKLSSHLQRPQSLAPLLDLEVEDEDYEEACEEERDSEFVQASEQRERGRDLRLRNRSRSLHRRARSMSPLRNPSFQWDEEEDEEAEEAEQDRREEQEIRVISETGDLDLEEKDGETNKFSSSLATLSVSASSSRSSSTGRSSKRWVFLKDFLRSKSEGRGNAKEKFWQTLSFSPSKEKKASSTSTSSATSKNEQNQIQKPKPTQSNSGKKSTASKPANGVASKRRRPLSPHELHYTANRAQAEEMKKRTFLPYRQGLLGCLGFSSKGYGAMNGFARSLHPVSSR
ncbi:hypothetical protein Sjap_007320 [Stephania japonica]|uniref:Stress response NST1-like protein n=1 Tax=Stephania japonica TaxID=461633 RepID=A0AAP0JND1_9MAGN